MELHVWECQHAGCGESLSSLGPASLVLLVRGHQRAFHPTDPELDTGNITKHPGYRPPASSVYSRAPEPVIDHRSRLEPYGMCNRLTAEDLKWLKGMRIIW